MAYPLSAYYGRITIAKLDKCAYCGRPYADSLEWHTMYASVNTAFGNVDTWCIACDKCYEETRPKGGGSDAR